MLKEVNAKLLQFRTKRVCSPVNGWYTLPCMKWSVYFHNEEWRRREQEAAQIKLEVHYGMLLCDCEKVKCSYPSHCLMRSLALVWGGLPRHNGSIRGSPTIVVGPGRPYCFNWTPLAALFKVRLMFMERDFSGDGHERTLQRAFEQKVICEQPLPVVRWRGNCV